MPLLIVFLSLFIFSTDARSAGPSHLKDLGVFSGIDKTLVPAFFKTGEDRLIAGKYSSEEGYFFVLEISDWGEDSYLKAEGGEVSGIRVPFEGIVSQDPHKAHHFFGKGKETESFVGGLSCSIDVEFDITATPKGLYIRHYGPSKFHTQIPASWTCVEVLADLHVYDTWNIHPKPYVLQTSPQ